MRGGVTRRRLSQLTQQELFAALEELPADVVKQIAKRHPLLIPPFTNDTLSRAVDDYLAGGDRKQRIRDKYGDIGNWDVSQVTDMKYMFRNAESLEVASSNTSSIFVTLKGALPGYENFYNILKKRVSFLLEYLRDR